MRSTRLRWSYLSLDLRSFILKEAETRRPRHPHPYSDPECQILTGFLREISTAVAARRRCANLVSATADELFCWLIKIAASRSVPLLRVSPSNIRCLASESRPAGCALLHKRMLR